MLSLPSHALFHPPEEVSRLIGLSFLKDAKESLRRLGKGKDPEALHDFRVALRRLRSCLRAYWPHVRDGMSKKLLNRVRDLARATAKGRDSEVEIALLSTLEDRLMAAERPALAWLLERLEERKRAAYEKVLDVVRRDHRRVEDALARRLSAYERRLGKGDPAESPCFVEVTRGLILEQAAELVGGLSRITPEDEALQHEVRIETKRLRYLLEPVRESAPGGGALVTELKRLQDLLGDIHDGKVVLAELARAIESRPPRLLGGLRKLKRLVEARERHLLEDLSSGWLDDGGAALHARLRRFAERLVRPVRDRSGRAGEGAGKDGIELERKFLLRELPEKARGVEGVDIEQGWVPNKLFQERVRRARFPDGDRYYRTFKVGMDLERVELEEEVPREVFDALWRLTRGHRVRKRRYRVKHGGLTWEIDSFAGRDLVVAEVELPSKSRKVRPPSWLKGYIVREVTGEPAFYNVNLAN